MGQNECGMKWDKREKRIIVTLFLNISVHYILSLKPTSVMKLLH